MRTAVAQLNQEMSALVERVRRSVVQISADRGGVGSGTIWRADGMIVTNAHVVRGRGQRLQVTLADGRTFSARLLAQDKTYDLALLSIPATGLPAVAVDDRQTLAPGEWIMGIGHPWGVAGAVTAGAVIDLGRPMERAGSPGQLLQVGLHLRPGHSGGPLVDAQGRLVGLSAMINGPDVGLGIPLHTISQFVAANLADETAQGRPDPETVQAYI